jgi:hypothetical protein
VQVVHHEQHGAFRFGQVSQEPLDDDGPIECRCRHEWLDLLTGGQLTQPADDLDPERVLVVLVACHADPRGAVARPRLVQPGLDEHRLAAARRSGDEDDRVIRGGRQPFKESSALDHERPT